MIKKLILWLVISAALVFSLFPALGSTVGKMFSSAVSGGLYVSFWGVLTLSLLWLAARRKELARDMGKPWHPLSLMAGTMMILASALLPGEDYIMIFRMLLAVFGVFIVIFSRSWKLLSIAAGIYGLGIFFPLAVYEFADLPAAQATKSVLLGISGFLGYPFHGQGQVVHLTSTSGENISVVVAASCAGPANMGLMLAFFALLMMDYPLGPGRGTVMLLVALAGTWAWNILRALVLLLAGYYAGESSMWTVHAWIPYFFFPLWFLLYAWLYFRQVNPYFPLPLRERIKVRGLYQRFRPHFISSIKGEKP